MTLDDFTDWLHAEIHAALRRDPHCKHYEGTMRIEISDAFVPREVTLTLLMYVIAPDRREHVWHGATVAECCDKARAEIGEWLTLDFNHG